MLCVKSVTSDGIAVLVRDSPNLMRFHVIVRVCQNTETLEKVDPSVFVMRLKQEYS